MTIVLKNKVTLTFDEFTFRCCIGKKGTAKKRLKVIKKLRLEHFHSEIYTIGKIVIINL